MIKLNVYVQRNTYTMQTTIYRRFHKIKSFFDFVQENFC